jgi:hypothetical protein
MRGAALGTLALVVCCSLAAEALAVDLTGLKGIGGSAGTSLMTGDWEYREHARPRFTGDALFKYGLSPKWAFVGMIGFGWNAYTDEERWLSDEQLRAELGYDPPDAQIKSVALSPFTAGLEYRFGTGAGVPYLGAGAGVYMTQLLFSGSVALDPRNNARHRSFDFGFYGRAGYEQFVSDVVSVDYDVLYHVVFSQDTVRFPNRTRADREVYGNDFKVYNGDLQNMQARIGLRYYWGGGL